MKKYSLFTILFLIIISCSFAQVVTHSVPRELYYGMHKGVYFHNSAKEGNPLEWTEQANISGANIESVNNEILRLGRDAAFVYWLTGDKKYGKFAYDVFNTYMTGMYYRNEPIDIGNGHANTLAGLSTFEVIQEAILSDLAAYYDFLHSYIKENHTDKTSVFESTFKKWIDLTIKNGVPHNNWNLHQANIILSVAVVLEDNQYYPDSKGREYYINHILNESAPRQWSIPKLMQYGYDYNTGIWNECPGYAQSVTKEFMHFIRNYDNTFNQNLLPYIYMNLWMKGQEGREVFSIKAPACKAFRGNNDFPYEVTKSPYLTIAARQHGEAWNKPFVSVFEPTTEKEGKSIQSIHSFNPDNKENTSPDFVGLIVKSKSGRTDYIFSSVKDEKVSYNDMTANGTYAVISENGKDFTLFLGNGTYIQGKSFTIKASEKVNAILEYKNGEYFFTCDKPVTIKTAKGKEVKKNKTVYQKINL